MRENRISIRATYQPAKRALLPWISGAAAALVFMWGSPRAQGVLAAMAVASLGLIAISRGFLEMENAEFCRVVAKLVPRRELENFGAWIDQLNARAEAGEAFKSEWRGGKPEPRIRRLEDGDLLGGRWGEGEWRVARRFEAAATSAVILFAVGAGSLLLLDVTPPSWAGPVAAGTLAVLGAAWLVSLEIDRRRK